MSDIVSLSVLTEIFNTQPAASSVLAKKLFADFTEQDRMLILLYFRWLTRMGARDLGITHLEKSAEMTDATREWLKTQGLENVDDWEFMGMIDHGSTGEITCSHGGHRLRYAYYAHSPSTGAELRFGLNCGSEFFQVDLGIMKKLTKVVDTAKAELSAAFCYGRASMPLSYSTAVTMAQAMRHDTNLAELCYRYAGKTQIELWQNFINRGIMPPKTLLLHIEQAYKMAVVDRLSQVPDVSRLIEVYNNTITNEMVYPGDELLKNKGIVTKGEFIYPLAGENLFNTLRVCAIEELMQPTPLSTYYNIVDFFTKIDTLEANSAWYTDKEALSSRAVFIYRYFSGQLPNIKNTVDVLVRACLANDPRYVTLMLGLSPSSNPKAAASADLDEDEDAAETEDLADASDLAAEAAGWFSKCWKNGKFDSRYYFAEGISKRRLLVLLFLDLFDQLNSALEQYKTRGTYDAGIIPISEDFDTSVSDDDDDVEEVGMSETDSHLISEDDTEPEQAIVDEAEYDFDDEEDDFEDDESDEISSDDLGLSVSDTGEEPDIEDLKEWGRVQFILCEDEDYEDEDDSSDDVADTPSLLDILMSGGDTSDKE